ncbi:MAG TPA: hypothetical protein VJ943_14910 [Desulfotignum sp.]|nr:hypothetical protein [Desulfotignum sp.]
MEHKRVEQKIRIDRLDIARLSCPDCGRKKMLQMSGHLFTKKHIKINFRCPCGYTGSAILEKPSDTLSDVGLAGTFICSDKARRSGRMTIKRLNSQGITFKTNIEQQIDPGLTLNLEFVLDDGKQSIVKKTVKVLVRNGKYLSAAFTSREHYDNLGPYLFFNKLYV